jgi:hypothetical protein
MADQQRTPGKGSRDFGSDEEGKKRANTGQLPAVGGPRSTQAEMKAVPSAPRATQGDMKAVQAPAPKPAGEAKAAAPKATQAEMKAVAPAAAAPAPAAAAVPAAPRDLTQYQKQQLGSEFQSAEAQRKRTAVLGSSTPGAKALSEEPAAAPPTQRFDGKTPAPELAGRDVWKAVVAPVQSREGHRSGALYDQVLKQFAVGVNARYEPEAPGKPRGHLFVWDVSRAMGCEVPHFVGAKELTYAQTCDWLRHEGPMRGWVRAGPYDVFSLAQKGQLVLALPKEIKIKGLGVVFPQPETADGKPLMCGAALERGWGLHLRAFFGVMAVEYFTHP